MKINYNGIEINGSTLLSITDAKKLLTRTQREYNNWWWLRSAGGSSDYACGVNSDGYYDLYRTSDTNGGVRPALKINLNSSNFKVGDCFTLGMWDFKIISNTLAFMYRQDIGTQPFSKDGRTNDYGKSGIKKYVNRWFSFLRIFCGKENDKSLGGQKIKINYNGIEINGATLLSTTDAKNLLTRTQREYNNWWWLRSAGGSSDYACGVISGGYYDLYRTSDTDGGVRPALKINLHSSNLKVGDRFTLGMWDFEIISDTLAFMYKQDIGTQPFSKDGRTNDYEQSDIKTYVDRWYNEVIRPLCNHLSIMVTQNGENNTSIQNAGNITINL